MLPKKGRNLPNGGRVEPYAAAIAEALKEELGTTHQAAKTVMRWTGAGERTVKNWISGKSGPSGEHLVALIKRSNRVLDALLILAGRHQTVATQKLIEARNTLADTVEQVDKLVGGVHRHS